MPFVINDLVCFCMSYVILNANFLTVTAAAFTHMFCIRGCDQGIADEFFLDHSLYKGDVFLFYYMLGSGSLFPCAGAGAPFLKASNKLRCTAVRFLLSSHVIFCGWWCITMIIATHFLIAFQMLNMHAQV